MLNYLNLFKEKNLSKNFSEIKDVDFVSEKILVKNNDYYYSNVIARSSKTMFNCKNEKNKFKSTGT